MWFWRVSLQEWSWDQMREFWPENFSNQRSSYDLALTWILLNLEVFKLVKDQDENRVILPILWYPGIFSHSLVAMGRFSLHVHPHNIKGLSPPWRGISTPWGTSQLRRPSAECWNSCYYVSWKVCYYWAMEFWGTIVQCFCSPCDFDFKLHSVYELELVFWCIACL